METPSTMRRVTRSQAKASTNNNNNNSIPISRKIEESEHNSKVVVSMQRNIKLDRSALFDITNDSPIVGLAMGKKSLRGETPSSLVKTKKKMKKLSPGSGEALLRDQVKFLLQKKEVQEDNEQPKFLIESSETETNIHNQDSVLGEESEKSDVTRDLFFEFLEKSECSSGLDDASSVWSVQVNTSTRDEDEEEDFEQVDEEEGYYSEGYGEVEEEEVGVVDELCQGLSKMTVEKKPLPEFEGKHIRFVYNSDGEMEGEEVVVINSSLCNCDVLRLKGMPTPQGKHVHFPELEEDEDNQSLKA